ncbi:hypothetical protein A3K82_00125 [Candidatus Pacearchaeota archaeon RBG_19FT_COMBO_34_9]|nr:MAG: hypothetical protein A3K82_00125 [Candidatus Pacearchaeota archaeon RBG_19FT_COMBO_34_9]OGJ17320.1 MAG: hypothetical protein A3K74_01685 [Candidatus Pacearchaeota archaeon RBG_13_33_26]
MVRPKLCRRIRFNPNAVYFKPRGIPLKELKEVILLPDEFESVKLIDLMGISQEESAQKMQISQPTLSRILKSARKKIADAIINGKAVKLEKNFKK